MAQMKAGAFVSQSLNPPHPPRCFTQSVHEEAIQRCLSTKQAMNMLAFLSLGQLVTLLTAHCFRLGGRTAGSSSYLHQGPCLNQIVFFIQDDTLSETLMLNLVGYPDPDIMPIYENDRASWEMDDPLTIQRRQDEDWIEPLKVRCGKYKLGMIGSAQRGGLVEAPPGTIHRQQTAMVIPPPRWIAVCRQAPGRLSRPLRT